MISVIICTYNREKYIFRCIESLTKNEFPRSEYEIVIVDNNCTDGTVAELERFKATYPDICIRYFLETTQGLSHSRNRGIREAKGDILIYVDDDAFVETEYLAKYADLFNRRPDVDAAGGPIVPYYESGKEPEWMTSHLRRLLTAYLYFGDSERYFPGRAFPGGGNAAYRKSVFDKVGLFNPELGRNGENLGGGEEKDIFDRMKTAGMKVVYVPDCVLHHIIPQYRLEEDYFVRITEGIGTSEGLRTLRISKTKYLDRVLSEVIKWGGTLVLSMVYMLLFKPQSSSKLLRFRWNVTKKLVLSSNTKNQF